MGKTDSVDSGDPTVDVKATGDGVAVDVDVVTVVGVVIADSVVWAAVVLTLLAVSAGDTVAALVMTARAVEMAVGNGVSADPGAAHNTLLLTSVTAASACVSPLLPKKKREYDKGGLGNVVKYIRKPSETAGDIATGYTDTLVNPLDGPITRP